MRRARGTSLTTTGDRTERSAPRPPQTALPDRLTVSWRFVSAGVVQVERSHAWLRSLTGEIPMRYVAEPQLPEK